MQPLVLWQWGRLKIPRQLMLETSHMIHHHITKEGRPEMLEACYKHLKDKSMDWSILH